MTYKGAIDEVISLANNSLMPVIFKPSLKKIAETLEIERPTATLDEIKAEIDRAYEELDGYDPSSLGTFAEKVDDILDKYKAEDRPKGQWIEREDYNGDPFYDCSVCGESFATMEGTPEDNMFSFCPTCGAKMKGGAK